MNADIFNRKLQTLSFLFILSYAYSHLSLTAQYSLVDMEDILNFDTRLPFGQRLFIPALGLIVSKVFVLDAVNSFFLLEWFFTALLYFTLKKLLEIEFSKHEARVLSWLFLLLLPLISIINYHFLPGVIRAYYYPWDTSTLFFSALSLLLCLKMRWYYFLIILSLATLNKESSYILVLLIPALHLHSGRPWLKFFFAAVLVYLLTRGLIYLWVHDLPGQWVEWRYTSSGFAHVYANLFYLIKLMKFLYLPVSMAGVPLFWFAFYDYIPCNYRSLRFLALLYFFSMLVVGNIWETRIYADIIVLLYLPVLTGIKKWLIGCEPYSVELKGKRWLYWLDRQAVFILLTLFLLFCMLFNSLFPFQGKMPEKRMGVTLNAQKL